jgi:hypothetical protein
VNHAKTMHVLHGIQKLEHIECCFGLGETLPSLHQIHHGLIARCQCHDKDVPNFPDSHLIWAQLEQDIHVFLVLEEVLELDHVIVTQ